MAELGKALAVRGRAGDTVAVTITPDLNRLTKALSRIAAQVRETFASVSAILARVGRVYRQRREVWVAGLEARYFVRGGLDSRYRDQADACALAARIMEGSELPGLTEPEAAQVAQAFIAGWLGGQGEGTLVIHVGRSEAPEYAARVAAHASLAVDHPWVELGPFPGTGT